MCEHAQANVLDNVQDQEAFHHVAMSCGLTLMELEQELDNGA